MFLVVVVGLGVSAHEYEVPSCGSSTDIERRVLEWAHPALPRPNPESPQRTAGGGSMESLATGDGGAHVSHISAAATPQRPGSTRSRGGGAHRSGEMGN